MLSTLRSLSAAIGIATLLPVLGCSRQPSTLVSPTTTPVAESKKPNEEKVAPKVAKNADGEPKASKKGNQQSIVVSTSSNQTANKPDVDKPPVKTETPKESTPAPPIVKKRKAVANPDELPLLKEADLKYVGAFRLPGETWGEHTFAYGGTALAVNPENRSLFLVGHDHHQEVAEVSIPDKLVNGEKVEDLPTASFVQPFSKTLNRVPKWTLKNNVKVGGLLVVDKKLYGTAYVYYDGPGEAVDSHFVFETTKLSSSIKGLFPVGKHGAGFVAGYMTEVPDEWRSKFGRPYLTGQAALAVIGRTSSGPAAFGFDPKELGVASARVESYVYYPLKECQRRWIRAISSITE